MGTETTDSRTPDRGRPLAATLVALSAALALIAIAALVLAGASSAAAATGTPAAGAAKKGSKRGPYPPARLWYRLQLDFEGSLSGQTTGDEGSVHYRRDEAWQLRSNGAVRVSLMCINRRLTMEPFFRKERIRRKGRRGKVTVGGCGSTASKNLVPTARFRAAVRGEATEWTLTNSYDPFRCDPFEEEQIMTEPQPLDGVLSSASTATEGLLHSSEPSTSGLDAASITIFQESTMCDGDDGNRYPTYGHEGDRRLIRTDHIGWEDTIDSEPTAESMRFEIPPRRFGRRISRRFGPFSQPFDISRPSDPNLSFMHYAAKDYSYTLTLIPCPRRGRNVTSC